MSVFQILDFVKLPHVARINRIRKLVIFWTSTAYTSTTMEYVEIIVAFLIGLFLVVMLGWVFSLKSKGLTRLVLNALAGAVVLVCFALFKVAVLPLNPLNALLVGFLGVPGLIVIYLITLYL